LILTVSLDGYHVDSADCCLIGILLGITMKKLSPTTNTAQYLQILPSTQWPNASIVYDWIYKISSWSKTEHCV